jgi:hypothetical protein
MRIPAWIRKQTSAPFFPPSLPPSHPPFRLLSHCARMFETTGYIFHLFSDAVSYSQETPLGLTLHKILDFHAQCFVSDENLPVKDVRFSID